MDEMDEPVPAADPALGDLRADAASPDGQVTATADGTGRLVGLEFTPEAMRKQSETLAALVLETVGRAQDAARELARERLAGFAPPLPSATDLTDTLQALQQTASSRLAEMSATLTRLLDRTSGGAQ